MNDMNCVFNFVYVGDIYNMIYEVKLLNESIIIVFTGFLSMSADIMDKLYFA